MPVVTRPIQTLRARYVRVRAAIDTETTDQVRYCRFERTALRVLLNDYPRMEKRLLEVAADELAAAQDQILLLGRRTARERLAAFLAAQSYGQSMGRCGRRQFSLAMTRADIAGYLGLTTETVSRTFTALHRDMLIEIGSRSQIVILDPVALKAIAGGLPCEIACKHAPPFIGNRKTPATFQGNSARYNAERAMLSVC